VGYGATGRILRVDLTRMHCHTEQLDEDVYRLYPGGKALAGYFMLREFVPGTDALSPDSVLVVANGLLTGAPVSTAARFTVAARSPLTGAYGESEAGGYFGPELKAAGYEAIIVTGRAAAPVYLSIRDANVEIRDAGGLWGREPEEVQAAIRAELGDSYVRVLQIGPGGENLVRYAALTNELAHFNGRTGMGAVMGSKNLKAIAVRGKSRYIRGVSDPAPVAELGKTLGDASRTTRSPGICRARARPDWSTSSTRPACCRRATSAKASSKAPTRSTGRPTRRRSSRAGARASRARSAASARCAWRDGMR
jgi:aldehyde:ferredoxin oxidoreductase